MIPVLEAPLSFAATLWASRRGLSRKRFQALQAQKLQNWLKHDVRRVRAYADAPLRLQELPIVDKATQMADFAAYNTEGITADQVRAALNGDLRIGPLTVGTSTGTSGNRGLFVISDAERFRWLGTILAKTMADLLWQPQRVAIILPQGTPLYDSANRLRRLTLRFFDITEGPETWRGALEAFAPSVLVAPPRVLRHFTDTDVRLRPKRVFSAAETLDPVDRPVIEAYFAQPLEQIYMATEGLLATTCRHGRLHLAEESVFFEYEPMGDGLVSPLISSFRRRVQIMARYRMNDLLRLDPARCPCGSPLQVVSEVVGRMDDCFRLAGVSGPVMITPDVLRNAVLNADTGIEDFRLVQTTDSQIELKLPLCTSDAALEAARTALDNLMAQRGARAHVSAIRTHLPLDTGRKLRRVECKLPRAY